MELKRWSSKPSCKEAHQYSLDSLELPPIQNHLWLLTTLQRSFLLSQSHSPNQHKLREVLWLSLPHCWHRLAVNFAFLWRPFRSLLTAECGLVTVSTKRVTNLQEFWSAIAQLYTIQREFLQSPLPVSDAWHFSFQTLLTDATSFELQNSLGQVRPSTLGSSKLKRS